MTQFIAGMSQAAQLAAINAVNGLFNNTTTPIYNNAGNPINVQVNAANADVQPGDPQILIDVINGPFRVFDNHALAGWDAVAGAFKRVTMLENSKVTFHIDAAKAAERKLIVDTLQQGLLQAYAIDQYGIRLEMYLMDYLTRYGIHRRRDDYLFEEVEYDPSSLPDPRPQGQVFSALVTMPTNIECVWWTPPAGTVANKFVMQPQSLQTLLTVTVPSAQYVMPLP